MVSSWLWSVDRADLPGPCQFPTLGFVVDQWNKMQSFVPEPFWYIYVAIEREDEADPEKVETVDFKWRRNHLFDMPCAVVLYEQCVQNPLATVISVETKPTTKWYVFVSRLWAYK
jgi:DNA topoisomerase-3